MALTVILERSLNHSKSSCSKWPKTTKTTNGISLWWVSFDVLALDMTVHLERYGGATRNGYDLKPEVWSCCWWSIPMMWVAWLSCAYRHEHSWADGWYSKHGLFKRDSSLESNVPSMLFLLLYYFCSHHYCHFYCYYHILLALYYIIYYKLNCLARMSDYLLKMLLETFPPYRSHFHRLNVVSTQQPRRSHLTRGTQQLKDLHGPKDTWQKPEKTWKTECAIFQWIKSSYIYIDRFTYFISSFTVTICYLHILIVICREITCSEDE